MKKRFVCVLMCAAVMLSCVPASGAAFTDIADSDTAAAAATLQGLGIVSGMTDTTFQPEGTLTRAQVCAMVVNALGMANQVNTYSRRTLFNDVAPSAWYNGQVNLAYAQGLINGYGNGTFGPDDPITYGQMATILLRMLGYSTAEIGSVWPMDYTDFADELGLSEGMALKPNQTLTRGEASRLLYRTLCAKVKGSGKYYYETISGVSATETAIILDVNATYGEDEKLLMVYSMTGSGEISYYNQANPQSDVLNGRMGVVLFDGSGRVMGVIPQSESSLDVTIGSATASALVDAAGTSRRISADTVVIAGGETYPYRTSGYLQLNQRAGENVRLFLDDSGSILCLYVSGGTASTAQAVVASTDQAASSLARALGLNSQNYTITKNGAAATSAALARYDVGYYDAASGTLRVSDWRVTGYISDAQPSVTAADTVTMWGSTFEVLECAWDTLGEFDLGDKVTLMLTDDGKVAAAYNTREITAEMTGVLARDGRSVTLTGSGITLKADNLEYREESFGGLVNVSVPDARTLTCSAVTTASRKLDLEERTLGDMSLAPSCAIYEWAGSGYVYDLEGNQGAASSDFRAIGWTDSLISSDVSWYHVNSAGQVDVVLLKDVTGNCYSYGKLNVYAGAEGINLGMSDMPAYNDAAVLENSGGSTEKSLCPEKVADGAFVGVAMGQTNHGYQRVMEVRTLSRVSGDEAEFFRMNGRWYAAVGGREYSVSDTVEVYIKDVSRWMTGEEGLAFVLADEYELTLYYDGTPSEGGQIRVICAQEQ